MAKTPQSMHGGARPGAGRPNEEPTERLRVPTGLVPSFRTQIAAHKLNLEILLPHPNPSTIKRPLVSSHVKAGFPSPADDYIEEWLSIDEDLIDHKEATFFVRAVGDSMIGAGILDGTRLVVDRSLEPRDGDIVVAVIDGDFTVKRLEQRRGKIRLLAENPSYPPIEFKEGQEMTIWGVMVGYYHKARRRS
jgi:DNA polymerase V